MPTPENKRFVDYLGTYYENSRGVQRAPATPSGAATPAASAVKTMNTRRQLHGAKGTTGAGIQSIKTAGKARTNSTK